MPTLVVSPGYDRHRAKWPQAGRVVREMLLHAVDQAPMGLEKRLPRPFTVRWAEINLLLETPEELPSGVALWEVTYQVAGLAWPVETYHLIQAWHVVHDTRFMRTETHIHRADAEARLYGLVHALRWAE